MRQRALSILLLVAAGIGGSGCVSQALLEHANKEEVRRNLVYEVTEAHRDADGAVVLCARGLPAERKRGLPPVAYGITLPATLFGDGDAAPPALARTGEAISSYRLSTEAVLDACPANTEALTPLPVRHVPAERLAATGPHAVTEPVLLSFIDEREAGAALYVFQDSDPAASARLVYRHAAPVYDGSRLVRIRLPLETVKPNRNAVIVLPLTLAVDTVLAAILVIGVILSGY